MNFSLRRAEPRDFLEIAALDRVVWTGEHDRFIPDGEHVWRVWCEYARVVVAESAALPDGPLFVPWKADQPIFWPFTYMPSSLNSIVVLTASSPAGTVNMPSIIL